MDLLNNLLEMIKGSAGGIAAALIACRFLYMKLEKCEVKHEKMTRALIAVAASDAKISAAEITKMLE